MRFINVDPIKDGWSWYAYAAGDPVSMFDPFGLEATCDAGVNWGDSTDDCCDPNCIEPECGGDGNEPPEPNWYVPSDFGTSGIENWEDYLIGVAVGIIECVGSWVEFKGEPETFDYFLGKITGNTIGMVGGLYLAVSGTNLIIGGGTISLSAVGLAIGIPAIAVGVVLVAAGACLVVNGANAFGDNMATASSYNSGNKSRSPHPPAKRNYYSSKKEAKEAAKKAGGKKEPIHHPDGKHGPHYHPDVPNNNTPTPKAPNSHDHYYYPK